jgi:hypothetical protein
MITLLLIAMPFGMLFFGPLVDVVNINYIFIAAGIVMLLLKTLVFISKTLLVAGSKTNER